MKVGDTTARIDVDLATANEHRSQLFSPALDARLHPRYGNADLSSSVGLGQASERRQLDGRAVRFRQAPNHAGQARSEFGFSASVCFCGGVGWQVGLQRIGSTIAALSRAERVAERISRDLKQPRLGPLGYSQSPHVANHAKKDVLQKIVRIDTRWNSPRKEGPQRRGKLLPED